MSPKPRRAEPRTEFELIAWLRERLPPAPDVVLGVGDDAAQVRVRGQSVLFCTDTLLEGVHFHLQAPQGSPIPAISPRELGHKALAVNLSDLAAMAARPLAAVVALTLRRGMPFAIVRGFFEGLLNSARRHDTPLVGGDTTAWDGPLAVTVSVLGAPQGTPVTRRGGRPGDRIMVTGALGGSMLGHHARFSPRLDLARYLLEHARPRAMIDISDGFVQDLGHLLEHDGLGAWVAADCVPIAAVARRWARLAGGTPRDHALCDGEDFELCFLLPPASCTRLLARKDLPCRITEVGVVAESGGVRLFDRAGREFSLPEGGYDHLAARSADPAPGERR